MSKKALHEVNRCHDPAFPVELYQVTHAGMLPPGRGLGDFHWHEELQFTLLTAGEGVMQVNAQDYPSVPVSPSSWAAAASTPSPASLPADAM